MSFLSNIKKFDFILMSDRLTGSIKQQIFSKMCRLRKVHYTNRRNRRDGSCCQHGKFCSLPSFNYFATNHHKQQANSVCFLILLSNVQPFCLRLWKTGKGLPHRLLLLRGLRFTIDWRGAKSIVSARQSSIVSAMPHQSIEQDAGRSDVNLIVVYLLLQQ